MKNYSSKLFVYNSEKLSSTLQKSLESYSYIAINEKPLSSGFDSEIRDNLAKDEAAIIINGKSTTPNFWAQRLEQVIKDHPNIQVCSALSCQYFELSPLSQGQEFNGDFAQLDQFIYLNQKPGVFFTNQLNHDCFIIRNKEALDLIHVKPLYACNNLIVQSQKELLLSENKKIGDQRLLPAHSLSDLHWRLKEVSPTLITNDRYFNLDDKPTILHITMDWGGGVQKWINDYSKHETQCHHMILASTGELYRHTHGEVFKLSYLRDQSFEITRFEMQAPIQSTCIEHPEYKSLLASIVKTYGISSIMVSSLIGHSFECLQTGLPTSRIIHDYFPSWPSLTANLDLDELTKTDLSIALEQTKNEPFGEIKKADYLTLRTKLHEIYDGIKLIAPSQSVSKNLAKIDPKLSTSKIEITPHGIIPLEKVKISNAKKTFDILVLGRINLPKGQLLLEEIIELLGNEVNFAFIGAGNEGKKYLKVKNIAVIMDYEPEELAQLLKDTQPNLALVTSVTSETYNYTLSELQSAAIPVVSTPYGALKERIIDGKNGFLVDANAKSFAEKIIHLKNNPDELKSVVEHLTQAPVASIEKMVLNYRKWLDFEKQPSYKTSLVENNENAWIKKLSKTTSEKKRTEKTLNTTQSELKQRTKWAQNLDDELKLAHKNIKLERKQIKYLKTALTEQIENSNKEIQHLKTTLQSESERMLLEVAGLNDAYQNLNSKFESSLEDIQKLNQELESVYTSRSWRVTKPIRQFTTWARHKRNAVKFRITQAKSIPNRLTRSLKTRGLGGTIGLIKTKLSKQQSEKTIKNDVELEHEYSAISFNSPMAPKVSVIIPVYNHFHHTYNCLKFLSQLKESNTFEVIVIDDFSSDETSESIKLITGITYHRQKQNGGFIESCNTGAYLAKGEFLLFLNNDTVVHDDWLDSLLQVFTNFPDTGLVGSKLVYPNGQLQEAGGIIFSDASGWNYGRMGDPAEPWYNHIREVDYCSGASILVRKSTFDELGRFDERYKPAYYEDTDLAFAMRNIGLKVYYQPASVVTHFEGISSGTDLSSGVKKYQVVNQEKFKEKWQEALKLQTKSGNDIEVSRIQSQPKRVLIFDACTPTPDQDAGSLRILNIIKTLKQLKYHVVFMAENLSFLEGYTTSLQQMGIECIYTPTVTNPLDYLKEKGKYFNHILLSRYYVAEPVLPFIRQYCPNAKLIFDTVDLHYLRERRMAIVKNDNKLAKIAEQTREKELAVVKACDTTLVVSSYEAEILAKEVPSCDIKVLSTIHEIYGCRKPYHQRQDIMFMGSYQHTPNVDALEWFVESIFPLIESKLPEIKFHIIGSKAPKHIEQMARDNIIFHGFVEDLEPFMDEIKIAVAPLRYGAGVKGKINMSMSYGQPVVGTKCALEGMYAQEGVDVLMAETPEEFALQIIRLYQDEKLWSKISQGGLANVESYFSFEAAKKSICEILI